jgi:hypothetical protein
MLRLKTESIPALVNFTILPGLAAIEKVADIKLHSRLSRQHFHHTAGGRLKDLNGLSQLSWFSVKHKIVIVASAEFQLLVVLFDSLPDRGRLCKVKWRIFYATDLPSRDQS